MDKSNLLKIRRWAIIQKISLQRAYTWLQMPMMGVIFASTIKAAFPGVIDSLIKFILLVVISFSILFTIGYLDRKFRFLQEEQSYSTETNPMLLSGLKGELS